MRLEARKYLFDIRLAADSISVFCAGKSFEQYRSNELLRAAVERKFGIIGEALARLATPKSPPGSPNFPGSLLFVTSSFTGTPAWTIASSGA
jgi:hypothetical protein